MNTAIALILSYVLLLTPPASTDSKPFVITGVVIERSGQPAAGAHIWLVEAITADQDQRFGMEVIWFALAKPSEGTIPVLIHGRADAAGRFSLDLPPEAVARHAPHRWSSGAQPPVPTRAWHPGCCRESASPSSHPFASSWPRR